MALDDRIAVIGATGYVGSRLVRVLISRGRKIAAIYRTEEKAQRCSWMGEDGVTPLRADVLNFDELLNALQGIDSAVYLVHSMYSGKKFEETDRKAAKIMQEAATEANLKKIVYLGGLGDPSAKELSKHLASRKEVGEILQAGSVPTTFLRAAMIIGSGSASFEILRYLVERLPVMTTPKWVRTKNQPIAISNVLNYIIGCLDLEDTTSQTYDIGGPDILTYQDLMRLYQKIVGLPRRIIIPVPLLTPRISSYWLDLVTPLSSKLTRPLVEGLRNEAICLEDGITHLIPQNLLSAKRAMQIAVHEQEYTIIKKKPNKRPAHFIPEWTQPNDPPWAGGPKYIDHQDIVIDAPIEDVWKPILNIGGPTGWYYADWIWQLRGFSDELIGGAGMRRGREDCLELVEGNYVDCWRVISVIPERYLKMRAEMWLPGQSSIEFILERLTSDKTQLHQVVTYFPHGLVGLLYWETLYPIHLHVWKKMLEKISDLISK